MRGEHTATLLTIVTKDNGITVEDTNGGGLVLPWNEINRIVMYRKDVYAGDLICLGIELANTRAVELDERMHGWDQLLISLPSHLLGAMNIDKSILALLAQGTNEATTVFLREG